MKAKIFDLEGKETSTADLPGVFDTPYRPDVIKRAVLVMQSNRRQPYGSDKLAGMRSSAHYHGKRRYRYTMMNREMARMPRIHGQVGYLAWRARVAPHVVKGRKAHPPKSEKIWSRKINARENNLAVMSALAASANPELLRSRGHSAASPLIFTDDFENVKNTKKIVELLGKISSKELERTAKRKIRAGRGTMRNRRYRIKKGPVFVLSKKCDAMKASKNIRGADVTTVANLNVELLAPGAQAGRLIVTTASALREMQNRFGE